MLKFKKVIIIESWSEICAWAAPGGGQGGQWLNEFVVPHDEMN